MKVKFAQLSLLKMQHKQCKPFSIKPFIFGSVIERERFSKITSCRNLVNGIFELND